MEASREGLGEHAGHQHYIITEDLYPLMHNWAKQWGFTIPDQRWFALNHKLLRLALEQALTSPDRVVIVDSLPYSYVLEELQQLVRGLQYQLGVDIGCVISLDRVYGLKMTCEHHLLEVNRLTHLENKDVDHAPRPHAAAVDEQIQQLVYTMTSYHVIVVDDGIWTGDSMRWILSRLSEHSIKVEAVVVGVHVKRPGYVVDHPIPVGKIQAVQTYTSSRPVLDWVCERDFFVGVPLGGRTIANHESASALQEWQSVGAFYSTKPNWLKDWASIEHNQSGFMKFCQERAMMMFAEIERLSHLPVLLRHLERLPLQAIEDNVPLDTPVREYIKKGLA